MGNKSSMTIEFQYIRQYKNTQSVFLYGHPETCF